jgi:hypothetical protein
MADDMLRASADSNISKDMLALADDALVRIASRYLIISKPYPEPKAAEPCGAEPNITC